MSIFRRGDLPFIHSCFIYNVWSAEHWTLFGWRSDRCGKNFIPISSNSFICTFSAPCVFEKLDWGMGCSCLGVPFGLREGFLIGLILYAWGFLAECTVAMVVRIVHPENNEMALSCDFPHPVAFLKMCFAKSLNQCRTSTSLTVGC